MAGLRFRPSGSRLTSDRTRFYCSQRSFVRTIYDRSRPNQRQTALPSNKQPFPPWRDTIYMAVATTCRPKNRPSRDKKAWYISFFIAPLDRTDRCELWIEQLYRISSRSLIIRTDYQYQPSLQGSSLMTYHRFCCRFRGQPANPKAAINRHNFNE